MSPAPELLLVGAVAAVGVLHTIVPDHWVPIALIARQQQWTRAETAGAALKAGTGHVLSTLAIALVVWVAGVAFARQFGQYVDAAASLALIGFGGWIAVASLLELRGSHGHGHSHHHHHHNHRHRDASGDRVHGPELAKIDTGHGVVQLSIYEDRVPARFRLTNAGAAAVSLETMREDGSRRIFEMADRGGYMESVDEIPEPHAFTVTIDISHEGHRHAYSAVFAEHEHVLPPSIPSGRQVSSRTALLFILGSSPMVEGIPAFFAAAKYGAALIALMSAVFALATIATYVVLCVYSTVGLQRVSLGPLERYGEVLSGILIAAVGAVFWAWPVL